jgi:hypothetical protein
MNDVDIHHEVRGEVEEGGWQLCFQWCTYNYQGDAPSEDGYRFIWRKPNGNLEPARGQARIPSAAHIFNLLRLASNAGWFVTVEPEYRQQAAATQL